MLISILVPSRRPGQLIGFFDSLEKNTIDFRNIEVIVKIDDDQRQFGELLENEIKKRPFRIRYIETSRHGGQFTLWLGLDELFNMVSDDSYFVLAVTDEARVMTNEWDRILKKYVGLFEDNIFRLRISLNKLLAPTDLFSCVYMPESFPIFTKKWLELTEGFGDCYGGDAYHELISYHLLCGENGILSSYKNKPISRDVAILDIAFGGFEFGKDVSCSQQQAHNLTMLREWGRLLNWKSQIKISYLAKKILLSTRIKNRNYYFIVQKKYKLVCVDENEKIIDSIYFGISKLHLWVTTIKIRIFLYNRILINLFNIYNIPYNKLKSNNKKKYLNKLDIQPDEHTLDILYEKHRPQGIFSRLNLIDFIFKKLMIKIGYILPNETLINEDYKKFTKLQRLRSKKLIRG